MCCTNYAVFGWLNEFSRRKSMKSIRCFFAVQFIASVLSCASAFGQPSTEASVYVYADPSIPDSQSDPHSASGFESQDTSSNFGIWDSSARANTTFGFNSAYADSAYSYETTYGFPVQVNEFAASASYSLNWCTTDNSQSGTLISVESGPGDSINGQYAGAFSFVYGTPYNIQSLLGVNSSYGGLKTYGAASSMWTDTITFLGQPDGTAGVSTFTVSLSGSITELESQFTWQSGSFLYSYDRTEIAGDFSGDATLSDLALPEGTAIEAASGTIYPVPEPGTLNLFGLGLGGLWLRRSKPKLWAALQAGLWLVKMLHRLPSRALCGT